MYEEVTQFRFSSVRLLLRLLHLCGVLLLFGLILLRNKQQIDTPQEVVFFILMVAKL